MPTLILPTTRTPPGAGAAIAAGHAPRIDYLDLAGASGGSTRVIDWSIYDRAPWRLLARFDRSQRLALGQALYALRYCMQSRVVYSLGEDVGLPLAWLLRRRRCAPRHILVSHHVVGRAKTLQVRALGGLRGFHRVVAMTTARRDEIAGVYRLRPERVVFLPNAVDERFWRPEPVADAAGERPLFLALGQAKRDYRTLAGAAEGIDARIRIQQSSSWHVGYAERMDHLPANVELGEHLTWCDLRNTYAHCRAIIVPLAPRAHPGAGTTTILEAMAMAKPVLVASHYDLSDYVRQGETGLVVPTGDARALRAAITHLLDHPDEAARMGQAGRRHLDDRLRYDDRIRRLVALAADAE